MSNLKPWFRQLFHPFFTPFFTLVSRTRTIPKMFLQSTVDTSTADTSQSTSDPDPDFGLLWHPETICAKGTADHYWLVDNSRKCIEFCKNQLKVYASILTGDG
jgi:hypothetical protein